MKKKVSKIYRIEKKRESDKKKFKKKKTANKTMYQTNFCDIK
jgi:hypothetical protein